MAGGLDCDHEGVQSKGVQSNHPQRTPSHPNTTPNSTPNRTLIALAYRAAYLAFSSGPVTGLGGCVVGSYGGALRAAMTDQPGVGETVFSALMWRSGLIALVRLGVGWSLRQGRGCLVGVIEPTTTLTCTLLPPPRHQPTHPTQLWYASAFPLLLHHHLPVQTLFFITYAHRLSGAACRDFESVHQGAAAVGWLARGMHVLQQSFFAAHGVGGMPTTTTAEAIAADGGGGAIIGCKAAVVFAQLVAGTLLPSFVIYCTEARARTAWLRRERAALRVRRWAAAVEAAAAAAGAGDGGGGASGSPGPHGGAHGGGASGAVGGGVRLSSSAPGLLSLSSPEAAAGGSAGGSAAAGGSAGGSAASGLARPPQLTPRPQQHPTPTAIAAAAATAVAAEACPAFGLASRSPPAPPSRSDCYLFVALMVGAWVVVTGQLPLPGWWWGDGPGWRQLTAGVAGWVGSSS